MSPLGSILMTGGGGQLGSALAKARTDRAAVFTPGRAELDQADPDSIRTKLRTRRAARILNPGGYTAVDRAEIEPDLAHAFPLRLSPLGRSGRETRA